MQDVKFTTTDGKMERFWLCLFLITGAQGLSMYKDHGLGENPGDAGKSDRNQEDCWSNATKMVENCAKEKISFEFPYTITLSGNFVFAKNFFSQACLIFRTIRDCHESIDLEECELDLPPIIANSSALATKFCRNEKDLGSLLGCMNNHSFQRSMLREPNSANRQQQLPCRTIENKIVQLLQTTESICGQKDYRTLANVMLDFDGDLSFVIEPFSAHCAISVNQVMPGLGVSVQVSQAQLFLWK
ncbi:uncharacterized protein LOC128162541 [Crassostrea angulata]|uniref:uncharacterized protein LOC128162541 n=1 Tax=Magallana angulata TaxID=2784310 RepID=UPI0022B0AF3A|nr:uncharacterized protein LOC128162541 [Crassostrea angulata]